MMNEECVIYGRLGKVMQGVTSFEFVRYGWEEGIFCAGFLVGFGLEGAECSFDCIMLA